MKKGILILALVNVCLLLFITGAASLAETYPLKPGDRLYGLQHSAEQLRLRMAANSARRVDFSIELAERRLADLAIAETERSISASADAFEAALNTTILNLEGIAIEQQPEKFTALKDLLGQADSVISSMDGREDVLTSIHEVLHTMMALEAKGTQATISTERDLPTSITGVVIPFLGEDVDHVDFPLTKGHSKLACSDCHADGEYANKPVECSNCHYAPITTSPGFYTQSYDPIPAQMYREHLEGECSDCHDTSGWHPSEFNHDGSQDCRTCHQDDLPKPSELQAPPAVYVSFSPKSSTSFLEQGIHYPGECALCHTDIDTWETFEYEHVDGVVCAICHEAATPNEHYPGRCETCHQDIEDWKQASADHDQAKDCLTCHLDEFPYDHYAGQCADCHNTLNWQRATFNHTNYYDCRSCHIKPGHHYAGQCSTCHDEAGWDIKNFNHSGQNDCKDCHTAPGGHASGQCSNCHTTPGWKPAKADHSEFASCAACHDDETPGGHYVETCSLCHSVGEWTNAQFNHEGAGACEGCHQATGGHYSGACTSCHNTENWEKVNFNHEGYSDCEACHNPPTNHYLGQCSNCHTTLNWVAFGFDHTGLVDCLSCHTADEDHYTGQCSNCHNTTDWPNATFDHTDADNCTGCHIAPSGHWPGQCSNCHDTDNWENIEFDHSNYTNCKSCHVRPAGHPRGQCSTCHTTESWIIPTETPEAFEALIPWMRATPAPPGYISPSKINDDENIPTRREPVPTMETPPSRRE